MYGCEHYLRRCQIYTDCCDKFYSCIHCHNEDNDLDHVIEKKDINLIKCTSCGFIQDLKKRCEECNTLFGEYFCEICKLFDDTPKQIVHCDECGICRVSLGKKLFHCKKCSMCGFSKHTKCYDVTDCPICCDPLWNSIKNATQTKCGHWIHGDCLNELLKNDYKCPTCQKSIIDINLLEKIIDPQVEANVMPDDIKNTKVTIYCRDCEKKTYDKELNLVAMKCDYCRSYNTVRE